MNDHRNPQSCASHAQHQSHISIEIVSANYGAYQDLRLATGELTNDNSTSISLTRDVTPFLRALLSAAKTWEEQEEEGQEDEADADDHEENVIPYQRTGSASYDGNPRIQKPCVPLTIGLDMTTTASTSLTKPSIVILGGDKSMNFIFGDPCPGTSKRLSVHYIVRENGVREVHHTSFAEHEQVILRRQLTFFQDDKALKRAVTGTEGGSFKGKEESENVLRLARRMGRSQTIAEFVTDANRNDTTEGDLLSSPKSTQQSDLPAVSTWRLRSAVSEIIVPLILPFLQVRERVMLRLVCITWKHIVGEWGVATTIDSNDRSIANFSKPVLRGMLRHSHFSLVQLFLSGMESLEKKDLHPSIPHLRKLRSLDLGRCQNLDDETMILLSEHVHRTIKVLYIKGLKNVSDVGIHAICGKCRNLEVLDISYVPVTDEGGMAMQQLKRLRALFLKDNYNLTGKSIDMIMEKCTRLAQLTLWGCIKLRHLQKVSSGVKLVTLNLWGCHNLNDDVADSLGNLRNLSSLIVSECHQLTDNFLKKLTFQVPQLNHLHVRYCTRLTDVSVNLITSFMINLYSLDLSFCNRITGASIIQLLNVRHESLSELRLKSCPQLDIIGDGRDGRLMVDAIRRQPGHCLSLLDTRDCSREPFRETDALVVGLKTLQFEQNVSGFFTRPARWSRAHTQLVNQIESQNEALDW